VAVTVGRKFGKKYLWWEWMAIVAHYARVLGMGGRWEGLNPWTRYYRVNVSDLPKV